MTFCSAIQMGENIMSSNIYDAIVSIQLGNKEYISAVLNRFKGYIKKYAYKLNYEDAEQDLIVFFIDLLYRIKITEVSTNDGALVKYFTKAIYHEYIHLANKKYWYSYTHELLADAAGTYDIAYQYGAFKSIEMLESLEQLTPYQVKIIIAFYLEGYSVQEIAVKQKVSRQAINKTKNSALKKMRAFEKIQLK